MSTIEAKNKYDKMPEYITSLFNVVQMAKSKKDRRVQMIVLVIFNYVKRLAELYEMDLKMVVSPVKINLIPIFEYVAANDIELYDFSTIDVEDVNVNSAVDLERYVLSHVYYLTQT